MVQIVATSNVQGANLHVQVNVQFEMANCVKLGAAQIIVQSLRVLFASTVSQI